MSSRPVLNDAASGSRASTGTASDDERPDAGSERYLGSGAMTAALLNGAGPTAADAQRAADALVAEGAERVLMFGSVARGCQHDFSDIDLVAVLPDLDYRRRRSVEERLRAAAGEASGMSVDVMATDRAEWRIQTECVSGSFANAISADALVLADISPSTDQLANTCWDKEQLMPASNEELATERLDNTAGQLLRLQRKLEPDSAERLAAEGGDAADHAWQQSERLIDACANGHMAIENALKAVGTLLEIEPRTLWEHNVEQLADALSEAAPADGPAMQALLASAPEVVKAPGYITMWRTVGAYGTVGDGKTAAEVATPRFTAALAVIAADVSSAAARWLGERGIRSASIERIARHASAISDIAASTDLGSGEPLAL